MEGKEIILISIGEMGCIVEIMNLKTVYFSLTMTTKIAYLFTLT